MYAVDSSSAALAWAQLNVERLNLASRVLVSKMFSCCIPVPCVVLESILETACWNQSPAECIQVQSIGLQACLSIVGKLKSVLVHRFDMSPA